MNTAVSGANSPIRFRLLLRRGLFDRKQRADALNVAGAPRAGEQAVMADGGEALAKRRAYNARMSLARGVASLAIGVQSPSVTLTSEQQQEMTSEGLTATSTASWLQALMLDTTRRL